MSEHHALAVANAILESVWRRGLAITPMQLQKLLYFCNGWNLEIRGEPLVADNFEAWQFGPVHPPVYHEFKVYGSGPIEGLADGHFGHGPVSANLSSDERQLIDEIVDIYGGLSGPQMSHLTHKPDTPWSDTWRGGLGKGDDIKSARIREEFEELRRRAAA